MPNLTIDQALENAVQHHRAGRLPEAERIYQQILSVQPENSDALHYLGILAHQVGNLPAAEELIRKAIAHNASVASYRNNLGNLLRDLGQLENARAEYLSALELEPDSADTHSNIATIERELGNLEKAAHFYQEALDLKPYDTGIHINLGTLLSEQGKMDESIETAQTALELNPLLPDAHLLMGNLCLQQGDFASAERSFTKATELQPKLAQAHFSLGLALQGQGRITNATAACRKAIQLEPQHAAAHQNLCDLLRQQGQLDEAIMIGRQAVRLNPSNAGAHYNLGGALQAKGQLSDAAAAFRRAIETDLASANAWNQLGCVLKDEDQLDEAETAFRSAIAIQPKHAEAHSNLGATLMPSNLDASVESGRIALRLAPENPGVRLTQAFALLLRGDLCEAWPLHEARFDAPGSGSIPRGFTQPKWGGQPLPGKRLLLHAEQGFGDSLQFIRYLPQVVTRLGEGSQIVLQCPAALTSLFGNLDGIEEIIADGQPLPDFECHLPLLSLPFLFDTGLENIPTNIPYLNPDPVLCEVWKEKINRNLTSEGTRKIGLVWAGSTGHKGDRFRSIGLATLQPLLDVECARFFSLQVGPEASQARGTPVIDLTSELKTFADTAALISQLDLVISVDTAVVHLAGALGKPVWILLPFAPDWRWMKGRSDSPWYPTMRLFRQPQIGDWNSVVNEVCSALLEINR